MELLGLGLELLESSLGVDVDSIFGVYANIELVFELLRCLYVLGALVSKLWPYMLWFSAGPPADTAMMMFVWRGRIWR